ncbi:hypothetical protein HZA97_02660 [Candidatus Woesearchaeota archaeon]|nr:hypothetical protein [Candidatus Woesearchaeota archaeon]
MKHTFWYIDQLMILLTEVIAQFGLDTDSQKDKARIMLDQIKKYEQILRKLVENHKLTEHLNTLHNYHIDQIPDWAERVNSQFKKLDALLKVLEEDIPKLEHALQSEPEMWGSRIRDMSLGFILAGFHHAEENMEEFRKAAVFERKHLQEIIVELEEIESVLE